MSEPREFHLVGYSMGGKVVWENNKNGEYPIHVIEKSAYDKAVEALKKIIGPNMDSVMMYEEAEDILRELGEIE